MEIDEKVSKKFDELISAGDELKHCSVQYKLALNADHQQACIGWLASAQNLVHLVVNNSNNPYRASIDKICNSDPGYKVPGLVGEVVAILKILTKDIDSGLLASIENQARASIFDDFLDHAKEYAKNKHPKQAGVIAGVVFEDTLRSICRIKNIEEKDKNIDLLINELVKVGVLSQVKAKRAKVAAHVRTKATHAQWDEFDLADVNTTVDITEELILNSLNKA